MGEGRVRGVRWVAVALAVALVAAALWWTQRPLPPEAPDPDALAAAQRVADTLRTGALVPDTFDEPERAASEFAALRAGLVPLTPSVLITSWAADRVAGTGTAALEQRLIVHDGKPIWTFTTTVALRRTPAGWRAVWAPTVVHPSLAQGERLKAARLSTPRGEVIGAGEQRLVHLQAVERIGLEPGRVPADQLTATAEAMAGVLGVDPAPYVARVRAAKPTAFVEAAVLRVGDPRHRTMLAAAAKLPGYRRVIDQRMVALTPTFARPLLGVVGDATAEGIAASSGQVREGDQVGLSGLQAAQDVRLRGLTGFVVTATSATGSGRELFRSEPIPGRSLRISLAADRQEVADAKVVGAGGPAAVVVLRPSDGHVLAAASAGASGRSIATQGRFLAGPLVTGLDAVVAPLRWGTTGDLGVPGFLGETSDAVHASPLGLAQAAASASTGRGVAPRLVLDLPEPASPPLTPEGVDALNRVVAAAEARPEWAVRVAPDEITVAYRAAGDAADLLR